MTLLLSLLIGLSQTAVSKTTSAESIRIAVEGAYPPFSRLNADGKPEGLDVDLAREICSRLRANCSWIVQDFTGMIPGLEAKRFDLIISSMGITEKRKEKVLFSDPYYKAPAIFVGLKSTRLTPPNFPETKEKIRVGVQRSTTYADFLKSLHSDKIEIVFYEEPILSFSDLKAGRIHLAIGQLIVFSRLLKEDGNSVLETKGKAFRDDRLMGEGAGIAARKSDKTLIERVNTALRKMKKDGSFAKIRKRYFDSACAMDIRECR